MSRLAKRSPRQRDMTPDPDASDVTLAQAGDLEAFERLYDRHVARINSLAKWMLGSTDTDDVIQDIFVRAWERLDTFRGQAPFGAWLHKLGVNVLLRYRERLRVHQDHFLSDEDAIQSAAAPSDGLQLHTEIESAIWKLPERVRQVLLLHDMEGYRHTEIAELLGISAATSRWHAHAGRLMLQEYFE
jgi:RNA polymerase sigma-70 factor (ECF subfamily)